MSQMRGWEGRLLHPIGKAKNVAKHPTVHRATNYYPAQNVNMPLSRTHDIHLYIFVSTYICTYIFESRGPSAIFSGKV